MCIYCIMSTKTVTLAMIVKNEQQVIGRLLSKVATAFDEIVIVDTGSTDNTIQLCRPFGTVYSYQWTDDFAAARNFAFSKATCQYIMWLDADDIMDDQSLRALQAWKISDNVPDTVMAKYIVARDLNGQPSVWYYRERILLNCSKAQWSGKIHEAIAPFGVVEYADFCVEHCPVAAHTSRNLKIFRNMIKAGVKLDERMTYYYARELYYKGYYTKALNILSKFVKNQHAYYVDRIEACKVICRILTAKKQYSKAEKYIFCAFNIDYPDAELCCLLADTYLQSQQLQKAKCWYVFALNCPKSDRGFVNKTYSFYYPLMQLCMTCDKLGEKHLSYYYHKMVAEVYPNDPSVKYNQQYFEQIGYK